MPDIDKIPDASELQRQLAAIETAIAQLQAGAKVSGLTVISQDTGPVEVTQVVLDPPVMEPNVITMLQSQQSYLIAELQQMGYTYTGTAIPPEEPPPAQRAAPPAVVDPPELPEVKAIPAPEPAHEPESAR